MKDQKSLKNKITNKLAILKRKVLDSYRYGTGNHMPKRRGK